MKLLAVCAVFLPVCCTPVHAQNFEVPAMHALADADTLQKARLSPDDTHDILEQVERTSFDIPESWDSELRARRLQIGDTEGLVLQATNFLCGGTGNCQTWVFRPAAGKWKSLFEKDAPIVSGYAFGKERSHGISNFVGVAHLSAESSSYVVFRFDGKFYRLTDCYQADGDHRPESVPCKE